MADELEAMKAVSDALGELEDDARLRVLQWANAKFCGGAPAALKTIATRQENDGTQDHETFAEFFHAAAPNSEKEKAAVAAYWLQFREGVDSFASQSLNSNLKDLGYKVSNITDALSQCMKEKPALIIQMKKSGSSKQARKTYKMTEAGRRWVEGLVRMNRGNENG